ncbi:MAG: ParB/RepB/Spo0J family partition protein, partial [Burkholderiales bacterium]|nr:ParB/RepB/Spo0J family partition protein [Burkholderiales bacterium]
MAKHKGLGRGLDALLGESSTSSAASGESGESLRTIAISDLQPGKYQPRAHMDQASLASLAESIKSQGIMQPILVRKLDTGRFEIIAGERRWRAAQMAGLKEVPVVIREVPDEAALAMALIENIQREDLNPIEEAQGIKRLIDEFAMTHEG